MRLCFCFLTLMFTFAAGARAQGPALRPAAAEALPGEKLEGAIARGIDYLLRTQNADGSWGSPRWTGGVDSDPVPGAFHSFSPAVTALGLEALLRASASLADKTSPVGKAAERAEVYLLENLPRLRRADPGNLPNIWGRPFYQDHLGRLLIGLQEADGSWYDYPLYSYHKPYGTAFALLSLACCRRASAGP